MAGVENASDKWARITREMERDLLGGGKAASRTGPNWKFFTPLLWAPVFPVIRLSLRNRPTARVRAFVAAIALANMHGIWLVNDPEGELFKGLSS
ncbi:hypothetical protein KFE25_008289 [Diacronema lutheri]|uniref:Uncharacterized protein n=2 Tax=Diacronema lutheri TaxID=2081491 RepID=A0A8J6CEH0_DIALT|nr:hypothetical protein KFE25_008289 [Diacronema lutheri]